MRSTRRFRSVLCLVALMVVAVTGSPILARPARAAKKWQWRVYLGAGVGSGRTVQSMTWKTVYQEPLRGEPRQDLGTGLLGGLAVEYGFGPTLGVGLDLRYETTGAELTAQLAAPHPFYFETYRPMAALTQSTRIHQSGAMLYLRVNLTGPLFLLGGPRLDLWSLRVIHDVTLEESAYPYDEPPRVTLHQTTLRKTAFSGEFGLGLQTHWPRRGRLFVLFLYRVAAPHLRGPHNESVRVRPQRIRLVVGGTF